MRWEGMPGETHFQNPRVSTAAAVGNFGFEGNTAPEITAAAIENHPTGGYRKEDPLHIYCRRRRAILGG